ncbi:MAG TPA: SPOR domain-containing protein [Longimicrobiales bacterium]
MQRTEGWPDAVSLDPDERASPAIDELLRSLSSTPVLLLAVGPLAQRGGWAANATLALADSLAASGERVVVADLSLDRPELHERLGVDNTEGLTDVFLFGASLEHVTLMLPSNSFELVPAAAFTPDTEEILTHRRWSVVFEELAASKTRLLLYLPTSIEGTGAFSDRVGHTVVLASRSEAEAVKAALSSDAEVLAFFAPPMSEEPEPPAPPVKAVRAEKAAETSGRMADSDFEKIRVPKDSAREALIADLRSRQRAALMAPAPKVQPLSDEVDVAAVRAAPQPSRPIAAFPPATPGISEPTFTSTKRVKPTKKRRLLPLLLVLLFASSLAAGWHYFGRDYWQARRTSAGQRPLTPTTPAANAAPAPEPPLPEGRPLPYSVAIAGYQLLDQAQERVEQLRNQAAGMRFYIAPTVVQGSLFYRVLAGPLPDSSAAVAVRDTLLARRIRTFTTSSDLVEAPYAFLIGSFDRRQDAETAASQTLPNGIPTYIVPVRVPGSANQYRVYVGTYTGPGDAAFMRTILRGASLPDTLVERTGSISS